VFTAALTEAVEKLFWGLLNERLIRDLALKGKNDSLRARIRFFHCVKAVANRVLQQPQPKAAVQQKLI
jgi:hypothetical protein